MCVTRLGPGPLDVLEEQCGTFVDLRGGTHHGVQWRADLAHLGGQDGPVAQDQPGSVAEDDTSSERRAAGLACWPRSARSHTARARPALEPNDL